MIAYDEAYGRLDIFSRVLEKEKNNGIRLVFVIFCLLWMIPGFILSFADLRIGTIASLGGLWLGIPYAYSWSIKLFKNGKNH